MKSIARARWVAMLAEQHENTWVVLISKIGGAPDGCSAGRPLMDQPTFKPGSVGRGFPRATAIPLRRRLPGA